MTVTLEHVTRSVDGIPAIRDVSLTLQGGTLNVLLGPTLSGKTSIMRLFAGLDKPTTGRVLVDGKDVTGIDVRRRSVAMVYQQFINYPSLPVYENIASPLRVAQVFSDPPLNVVGIEKRNGSVQYAGGVEAPASGLYAGLSDGRYRVGFRAHQLELANGVAGRHAFAATVTVTEITGSESFVHLNRDASNWVAVLHGVHEFPPGHVLDAVLDPNNVFVFDAAGRVVAAPGAP